MYTYTSSVGHAAGIKFYSVPAVNGLTRNKYLLEHFANLIYY